MQYPPPEHRVKLKDFLNDPLALLHALPQKHPDIAWLRILNRQVYLIQRPEYAKYILQENHSNFKKGRAYKTLSILLGNGLLNSEGDFWKRQRRLAAPAFHRDRINNLNDLFVRHTTNLLKDWKQREGSHINFTQEMARLTIGIVCEALFGASISPDTIKTVWQQVDILNELAMKRIQQPVQLPLWLPTPMLFRTRQHVKILDDIVYGIIRQRTQNPNNQANDLLAMLTNAKDEDTGEQMSEKQLRDEVMTIFLAGHETTVNALSWMWLLVKKDKTVENQLKEHYWQNLNGNAPSMEQSMQLKYASNVMNEALRLHPPVYLVGRQAYKPDHLDGFDIGTNTNCIINIYGIHRHPLYWQNPHSFMPDRFEGFQQKGDNRFIFMPFGGGARICIGNNFALTEMHVINALLAQHVEMDLLTPNPRQIPQVTLKPEGGVWMHLKKVNI